MKEGLHASIHEVLNTVAYYNIVSELGFLGRLFITNIADLVSVTGARCFGVEAQVNGGLVTWSLM